jgi:sialate O-acetylesterase
MKLLPATILFLLLTALRPESTQADIRLPNVFTSHMVVQQDKPIVIWGWAAPHEKVTIQIAGEKGEATANEKGEWKATLPALKAGGPHTLKVSGSSEVQLEDVMVGEVWLCSGQSNMEMGIGMSKDGKEEIAAANYPGIRLLMVPNRWTPTAQTNFDAAWKVCAPATLAEGGWGGFSAAGYFFGRELHKKLGVTVGLIDATWGGTRIESWTPPEGFAEVPALKREYDLVQLGNPRSRAHQERLDQALRDTQRWLDEARIAMASQTAVPPMPAYPSELLPPHDLQQATALYNGMIHPVYPFSIRGAIWYQGESNLADGKLYTERMKALIAGWRKIWNEGEFPFYFVQIAPYNYGGNPEALPEFWEAQAAAETIPNVGMAVITDIGNLKDIHPTNKQEVGRRLALLALAKTYGKKDVVCSGPVFKNMAIEGDKLRITFDQAGSGLASRDGQPLNWFEIIDADEGPFVKAEVKIEGSAIVLSSLEVKHPVAMRFAWNMFAEPNLMNSAGLPATAFRAGTAPKRDLLVMKVPEAKDYKLLYDLDLKKAGSTISYDVDNRDKLRAPFDRVAYFLELQSADDETQYAYVSLDAFTDDLDKIGVPTLNSGARWQQNVKNMSVVSNVKGIRNGSGIGGGNIEFWPQNYGPANSSKVPNASSQVYDFGDEPAEPADGYGSMQIHNHDTKQTILAFNHWSAGEKADIGIGNQPSGNPDWTFAGNAGSFSVRRLRVFIHPK